MVWSRAERGEKGVLGPKKHAPPQSPPRRAPTGRGPGSSGSGSAPGAVCRFSGRGLTVSCAPPGAAPLLVRGHSTARRPSSTPPKGAKPRLLLCCGRAGPSNFNTATRWVHPPFFCSENQTARTLLRSHRPSTCGTAHWQAQAQRWQRRRGGGQKGHSIGPATKTGNCGEREREGGKEGETSQQLTQALPWGAVEFPVNTKARCMGPRAEWVVVAWAASQRAANCGLPHRNRARASCAVCSIKILGVVTLLDLPATQLSATS